MSEALNDWHTRWLAEQKARMVAAKAAHRELMVTATGLRKAILGMHGPRDIAGPMCTTCEAYDGGIMPFPCTTYVLARDWSGE